MAKSNQHTVQTRVHDVSRLLLAGAEFAEIRQYASEHSWQVSERQVRRYMETAYKRLARTTKRDRNQLLGRHLMQRRALYARSIKANDIRSALQVLRDEAALQGLYLPTKIAPTTPDGQFPYPGPQESPLSRRQRLVRLLAAEAKGDKAEIRLIEHITPTRQYLFPDTTLPRLMLHILALTHVTQQLEQLAVFLQARWRDLADGDADGTWLFSANASAYRFRIGREGWRLFTEGIGVDGDALVRGNYLGIMLDLCADPICELAPSPETLRACFELNGRTVGTLTTAEDLAKVWRRMLAKICDE